MDGEDQSCTRCSPYSTSLAQHGHPCEPPLMKSFGGTCFHGRGGRLPTLASCISWSLLRAPHVKLLPCISESASGHVANTCLLLQALLPTVFHNTLVSFFPTPKPCPLLQAIHTQLQGSKFQKASLFIFLSHRTYQST